MNEFFHCKAMTNNMDTYHKMLDLAIGEKAGQYPIQITADEKGVRFDICSEEAMQEGECRNAVNANVLLKEGEIYSFGGYEWIVAEKKEGYVVLQSTGVTAGAWPGYKMKKFGDGAYFASDIDGQDISGYDTKTTELYNRIKSAEYAGAEYGNGLFLVSNEKARTTSEPQDSGHYLEALKEAAVNNSSFGASGDYAWLGTVNGSNGAWYVVSVGTVYDGFYQNFSFVLAPAFNLDTSKIVLKGNEITLK